MPMIAPSAKWETLLQKMKAQTPETFASDGRILRNRGSTAAA
jgi:hypothetical protein